MTDASHAISRNSPLTALHLLTAYSKRLGKPPLDNPQARSRFHTFYSPEFDNFLFALIGADRNHMPVSVLSALARLDVDPWEVAAELTELSKDAAAHKLASLFARLPSGRLHGARRASGELLPRRVAPRRPRRLANIR